MTLTGHTVSILLARQRAVDAALALVGLAYPAARYEAELYPHDAPASRHQMAGHQSSCGLTCEAILRAVGADAPVLGQPYGPRSIGQGVPALAWQESWARQVGAWVDTKLVDPRDFEPPEPGDMWRQGSGSDPRWYQGKQLRYEHVGTVVEAGEGTDGQLFTSVEGGQPGIASKVRRWVVTPLGELWTCRAETPIDTAGRPVDGARVAGYIDLSLVPLREVGA